MSADEEVDFRAAIKICYEAVNREMVHQIKHHVLKKVSAIKLLKHVMVKSVRSISFS